ncbi:hypothetical protein [Marichromatium gracile]|uniref:Uncharacterized protein n=1 Tax=Marichromatium gracile TaxID=1048 RepID=A0A4R4A4K6_MARGR|nr:hypothetical protein [Marichromatium gracile]MBK1709802.1 hypothetical protein [Marichromatium gracile]TCW32688.1 hypothetical protein EDC29_11754 [Marichromatium gracile]
MRLTRLDTGAALDLPDDLYWEDEHARTGVRQSITPSLTGAALIQVATLQYRALTLRPWAEDAAWIDRAQLDTLSAWAALPDLEMTLERHGHAHQVRWRYDSDGRAILAEPVLYAADQTPYWRVSLMLLVV